MIFVPVLLLLIAVAAVVIDGWRYVPAALGLTLALFAVALSDLPCVVAAYAVLPSRNAFSSGSAGRGRASGALTLVAILAGAALCLPLLGLLLPALLPDRPVRAWEVALLFVGPVYGVAVGAVLRWPRRFCTCWPLPAGPCASDPDQLGAAPAAVQALQAQCQRTGSRAALHRRADLDDTLGSLLNVDAAHGPATRARPSRRALPGHGALQDGVQLGSRVALELSQRAHPGEHLEQPLHERAGERHRGRQLPGRRPAGREPQSDVEIVCLARRGGHDPQGWRGDQGRGDQAQDGGDGKLVVVRRLVRRRRQ